VAFTIFYTIPRSSIFYSKTLYICTILTTRSVEYGNESCFAVVINVKISIAIFHKSLFCGVCSAHALGGVSGVASFITTDDQPQYEAAVFSCRLCFPRAFPFISLIIRIFETPGYTVMLWLKIKLNQ